MAERHILIIDKDSQIMTRFFRELAGDGYHISTASNHAEALKVVERGERPVELALVYLSVSDDSPISLAHRLMNDFDVPTLFFSPDPEKNAVADAVAAGGIGFLVEPLSISQVLPSVKMALEIARELRVLARERKNLQTAVSNGRDTNVSIGILMERNNLSRQEAFNLLRQEARHRRIRLEELGKQVVTSTDILNSLGDKPKKETRSKRAKGDGKSDGKGLVIKKPRDGGLNPR